MIHKKNTYSISGSSSFLGQSTKKNMATSASLSVRTWLWRNSNERRLAAKISTETYVAFDCECLPLFWASCFLHIWLLMFVVSCWSACYSKSARRTKTAQTRCWSHSLAPAHHAAGSRGWSSCKTSGSKSTFHSTSLVFFSTELIHSPISMFCLSSAQVCSCCDLHLS